MTGLRSHAGRQAIGAFGSAVEVIVDAVADPAQAATVASWIIHAPGQSPAWDHYRLSVIHLRPIPGSKPADVRVPGATHEVLVVALDPAGGHDPADPNAWRMLRPVNVCEQIELPDDQAAAELADAVVQAVLAGVLPAEPPLSGQREPWRTTLIQTAAHARGEAHAGPDGTIITPEADA